VVLCELTHSLRINQSIWIFEFLFHPLKWRVKVIWKYFINLDKDGTIQRQQVNKQQRAWSQSGRQHMVTVVTVARFELKLHKQVKRFPAFILSDLIRKKGVVCLSCFVQIFANILFAWFEMEERGCLSVLLCANILFALNCSLISYFAFHQSVMCYNCISYSLGCNFVRGEILKQK